MQVVDTLEILFDLSVVESYHLDQFLHRSLCVATLDMYPQLPRPQLNPEIKRLLTLPLQKLCTLIILLLRN